MRSYLVLLCLVYACVGLSPTLPTGTNLTKIVVASYDNVDSNKDGSIERDELLGFPVHADLDHDGCMSLEEYKRVTAGTPLTAERLFHSLDPANTDCISPKMLSPQFNIMDTDHNHKADMQEFSDWYTNLVFGHPVTIVG